jgi:feruloyl esterase
MALSALILHLTLRAAADAPPVPCTDLVQLHLPQTTITLAESVPAGLFAPPDSTAPIADLPAFCRVAAVVSPAINFEVWLPASSWNGKFQGVGNTGLAGTISYPAMATALRRGYATSSTDTGHTGTTESAVWALGHPELVVDYGFRAIHEMTRQAKSIVHAFYGERPQYAYFNGCSTGGRQALMEVQRFPHDYHGVTAGAPANSLTHIQMGGNWISQALHEDPASFIPTDKIPLIDSAVLAACDAQDGLIDGVIDDPRRCDFDPAVLQCKPNQPLHTCLNAVQVRGLQKVYEGARNPRTGRQIFPGYLPGGELAANWGMWIFGTATPPTNLQHLIQDAIFKFIVFEDPSWDWTTFDFDRDVRFTDQKVGGILDATDPDLRDYQRRGGKIIMYHGWSDPAISPQNSIDYYQRVLTTMHCHPHCEHGQPHRGDALAETQEFFRLFMAPGMGHCRGGAGPNTFDALTALERWVEEGIAPDKIIASHVTGGGVDRTRPLCPYPAVAWYTGSGSIDDAANFVCRERYWYWHDRDEHDEYDDQ